MKKVCVNRQPIIGPWGGGNQFVIACYEHFQKFGMTIVGLNDDPDVILMIDPRPDGMNPSAREIAAHVLERGTPVVHRINECDARKATRGTDAMLQECQQFVKSRIFVSNWLQEHLQTSWGCAYHDSCVIVNGADTRIFSASPPRAKFNNQKINIVSAHWSDNYMKGQDTTEFLDSFVGQHSKEFTFTFIGRTQANLKNTTLIKPIFGELFADALKMFDVSISGSRFDPGPNSVIEPIACGIPTYVHTDGGGGVEFAGKDHAFRNNDELGDFLLKKAFTPNAFIVRDWEDVIREYAEHLYKVMS